MIEVIAIVALGVLAGGLGVAVVILLMRKAPVSLTSTGVTERVRAVGRLVGLEVHAKEIATSTKGWSWVPPILLSQAKIAMIFHFEKQYSVDLSRLNESSVECTGVNQYRVTLPSVDGALRLTDVTPYDIQAGKVLGLLDVLPVGAATQKELMARAQEQAADLYEQADERYEAEAMHSIERQLESLLSMFGVTVEVRWEGAEVDEVASAG